MDLGTRPPIDFKAWRIKVWGAVEKPGEWTWEQFKALPRRKLTADFHCVTRWSRYDLGWEGVAVADLLALAKPKPEAKFLVQHCGEGYTTNTSLADAVESDCLLADTLDGKPLPLDHGGPLRMLIPKLYAWKSGKFLVGLEVCVADKPGYWEVRGYHNRADPWLEERYGDNAAPPPGADDSPL